jgi:hypothetical protein
LPFTGIVSKLEMAKEIASELKHKATGISQADMQKGKRIQNPKPNTKNCGVSF